LETKVLLARKLIEIQFADQNQYYDNRNLFTYEAIALALLCGYKAGIRIDPAEPEWPVAFLELPTGQISYHLQAHSVEWDKHTTEEKQIRLLKYVASVNSGGG
jgi:hypothetical protein